jgi:hypothetical protein
MLVPLRDAIAPVISETCATAPTREMTPHHEMTMVVLSTAGCHSPERRGRWSAPRKEHP